MGLYVRSADCCGLNELGGVNNMKSEGDFIDALRDYYDGGPPNTSVVFTDAVEYKDAGIRTQYYRNRGPKLGGEGFANFLKKHNLGRVVSLPPRKNHNSGNQVKVWLWQPPRKSTAVLKKFDIKVHAPGWKPRDDWDY